MAKLPIITGAETEILHKKARKVKDVTDPEIQRLIRDMFESIQDIGIGLAAPQVNQSIQLCVIELDGKKMVFANPTITSFSKEKILFEEGCLSLPEEFFFIERSEKITVRFQNEKGEDMKLKATGLLAVALQHEIDHLEGTLIVDRFKKQKVKPGTPVWQ